jgi:hypothetical protein
VLPTPRSLTPDPSVANTPSLSGMCPITDVNHVADWIAETLFTPLTLSTLLPRRSDCGSMSPSSPSTSPPLG